MFDAVVAARPGQAPEASRRTSHLAAALELGVDPRRRSIAIEDSGSGHLPPPAPPA